MQYLVTKGVPCEKRIKDVVKFEAEFADELEKDAEDGWVETTNPESLNKGGEKEEILDIDDMGEDGVQVVGGDDKGGDDDGGFDLDALSDDDNLFAGPAEESKTEQKDDMSGAIKKVRKYDLSITYDFYTQTPRLWLTGFNEEGVPLTQDEIFEDIMADYAKKTVTMLSHPHAGTKQASIHPCNHAKVMKTMNDTIISNGGQPQVTQCMFVFLKFISSVIPTI